MVSDAGREIGVSKTVLTLLDTRPWLFALPHTFQGTSVQDRAFLNGGRLGLSSVGRGEIKVWSTWGRGVAVQSLVCGSREQGLREVLCRASRRRLMCRYRVSGVRHIEARAGGYPWACQRKGSLPWRPIPPQWIAYTVYRTWGCPSFPAWGSREKRPTDILGSRVPGTCPKANII